MRPVPSAGEGSKDLAECTKSANENPVACVATVEGDQPRVRAFSMWFADSTGFYFHTGTAQRVYRQLLRNPNVELCFYAPGEGRRGNDAAGDRESRVPLPDTALEQRLMNDWPWVGGLLKAAPEGTKLAMFSVAHGEAYFWTMADNMREDLAEKAKF